MEDSTRVEPSFVCAASCLRAVPVRHGEVCGNRYSGNIADSLRYPLSLIVTACQFLPPVHSYGKDYVNAVEESISPDLTGIHSSECACQLRTRIVLGALQHAGIRTFADIIEP